MKTKLLAAALAAVGLLALPTVALAAAAARARAGLPNPAFSTVHKSVTPELEFTVWSAAVSPGCGDLAIPVAPQGPKKLIGVCADGHMVTMTRRRGRLLPRPRKG